MEASMTEPVIMSPDHPRWREFQHRLALAVVTRCDPNPDAEEPYEFDCDGTGSFKHTRRILAGMGFTAADIETTLNYWATETGNCCDCEALVALDTPTGHT